MAFIYILLYIGFGILLMGILFKLYASNSTFAAIMENIQLDDMFEQYGDEYVVLCICFACLWPIILLGILVAYPFAWIQYTYENKWNADKKEDDSKKDGKSLEI